MMPSPYESVVTECRVSTTLGGVVAWTALLTAPVTDVGTWNAGDASWQPCKPCPEMRSCYVFSSPDVQNPFKHGGVPRIIG